MSNKIENKSLAVCNARCKLIDVVGIDPAPRTTVGSHANVRRAHQKKEQAGSPTSSKRQRAQAQSAQVQGRTHLPCRQDARWHASATRYVLLV
jgi:hypothetical protein